LEQSEAPEIDIFPYGIPFRAYKLEVSGGFRINFKID
jgi:hypothetical protein